MDVEAVPLLPLACRFVPHDQWLVTHLDPLWRISQVKVWLVAKSLGLRIPLEPIDMNQQNSNQSQQTNPPPIQRHRPVSPITFAPDPRRRTSSPIMFAAVGESSEIGCLGDRAPGMSEEADGDSGGEGDNADEEFGCEEDDDEWEHDAEDDKKSMSKPWRHHTPGLHNLSISSSSTLASSVSDARRYKAPVSRYSQTPLQPPTGLSKELQPHLYTLIRFSTGQVLEDDFLLSWYDLSPHELVEVHGGDDARPSGAVKQTSRSKKRDQHLRNDSSMNPLGRVRIISLNRWNLNSYVTPYWEGWVWALRVVWREEYGYGYGYDVDPWAVDQRKKVKKKRESGYVDVERDNAYLKDGDVGVSGAPGKRTKLEWKERWVVIRDGVFTLCKDREESVPTHCLPLSSLVTLRGPEQLSKSSLRSSKSPTKSSMHGSQSSRSSDNWDQEEEEKGHRIVCAKFRFTDWQSQSEWPMKPLPVPMSEDEIGAPNDRETKKREKKEKRRAKEVEKAKRHNQNQGPYLKKKPSASVGPPPISSGGKLGSSLNLTLNVGSLNSKISASGMNFLARDGGKVGRGKRKEKGKEKDHTVQPQAKADDNDKKHTRVASISSASEDDLDQANEERDHVVSGQSTLHHNVEPESDAESVSTALSSPIFAHDIDPESIISEEGLDVVESAYRHGYRYGYQHEGKGKSRLSEIPDEQTSGAAIESKEPLNEGRKEPVRGALREADDEEQGEWVVLEMGSDNAFNSILRILHRHFLPPITSSFIAPVPALSTPTATPTPTPFPSPTSSKSDPQQHFQSRQVRAGSFASLAGHALDGDELNEEGKHPKVLFIPSEDHDDRSSISSLGSPLQFQPQHPPSLAYMSRPLSEPLNTFGALPYPEWREAVVEKAQKSGMGPLSRAMEFHLWGDIRNRQKRGGIGGAEKGNRRAGGENKARKNSKTRKGRRKSTQSYASTITDRPIPSPACNSDLSDTDDSEEDTSEAEWQGWMADLYRQNKVRKLALARSDAHTLGRPLSDVIQDATDDQQRLREERMMMEPSAVVTSLFAPQWNFPQGRPATPAPSTNSSVPISQHHSPNSHSAVSTPSATLSSPSSSESLARRQRTRALSFGFSPDPFSSSTTLSSHSHHTHSRSHSQLQWPLPNTHQFQRGHTSPPPSSSSLYHSASMYADGLRSETVQEPPHRRPSMPILDSLQPSSLFAAAEPLSLTSALAMSPEIHSKHHSRPRQNTVVAATSPTVPRRASSAGLASLEPGGSLTRSSSVLLRGVLSRKETDVERDKGKSKDRRPKEGGEKIREREGGEKAQKMKLDKDRGKEARKLQRPKLSLVPIGSSGVDAMQPRIPISPQLVRSPTVATKSILRRVKSGSSLISDEPRSPTAPSVSGVPSEGPVPVKKKKGLAHGMEKLVRGLDSALDFGDGR